MTPKQVKFCDEYLIDTNATQAAIRAGYSKKTANEQGAQNLAKLSISEYIKERLKMAQKRNEITLDDIIAELNENRRVALAATNPQSAAATAATMGKAKLLGFVIDKQETKLEAKQPVLIVNTK